MDEKLSRLLDTLKEAVDEVERSRPEAALQLGQRISDEADMSKFAERREFDEAEIPMIDAEDVKTIDPGILGDDLGFDALFDKGSSSENRDLPDEGEQKKAMGSDKKGSRR